MSRRPSTDTLFPYTTLFRSTGASGYFNYFGAAAGAAGKGYYSYDLGAWHVVALNSNIAMNVGSPQEVRSEEHTSELQSHSDLVCRLPLEHKNRRAGHAASLA